MNNNDLNNNKENKEEIKEVSNELNEANFENKKTIEPKKGCFKGGYKAISLAVAVLALFAGSIMIKNINNKNKNEVEGEVVSLSDLQSISKEVVNLKSYTKEGLSRVEDTGEYGGGIIPLDDGKYLVYSIQPNKGVAIDIYNESNSLIFKTKVKQDADNQNLSVMDAKITVNNEIMVSILYDKGDETEYSKIIKFNLEEEILSELKLDGIVYLLTTDTSNNTIVVTYNEATNIQKMHKFSKENKKLFEYTINDDNKMGGLIRLFTNEDKIILFTSSFKNKLDNKGTMGYCILNEKGEKIFEKEDTGYTVEEIGNLIQTSDGNFLIEEVEISDDLITYKLKSIIKLNPELDEIFEKEDTGYTVEEIGNLIQTSDGNFLIEEVEISDDLITYKLKSIIKLNPELDEIWKKEVNKVIDYSEIVELNNEYVLFMNEVYNIKEKNTISKISSLTKIDSLGEKVWSKHLDYDKNKEFNIVNNGDIRLDTNIYALNDNLVIKASVFDNNESQGYIRLTIDSDGNIS